MAKLFHMSSHWARQAGRVQLEQSDMRLALNMRHLVQAGISGGTADEMTNLIKKPRAELREEKKRGVIFPGHRSVKAVIEKHPAMVYENQSTGCLHCQDDVPGNPETRWKRKHPLDTAVELETSGTAEQAGDAEPSSAAAVRVHPATETATADPSSAVAAPSRTAPHKKPQSSAVRTAAARPDPQTDPALTDSACPPPDDASTRTTQQQPPADENRSVAAVKEGLQKGRKRKVSGKKPRAAPPPPRAESSSPAAPPPRPPPRKKPKTSAPVPGEGDGSLPPDPPSRPTPRKQPKPSKAPHMRGESSRTAAAQVVLGKRPSKHGTDTGKRPALPTGTERPHQQSAVVELYSDSDSDDDFDPANNSGSATSVATANETD